MKSFNIPNFRIMKTARLMLGALLCLVFIACQEDPCEGVICLNDGYCTDGQCVCPEQYTGADCSEEIPPSKIRINSITVTQFPATKANGNSWDPNDGPDIFPAIYDQDGEELWKSSAIFQNAVDTQTYNFQISPILEFDNPESPYLLRLFDFETSPPDELMGEIQFTPYMEGAGFPAGLTIDNGEGLEVLLEVVYF